ncbi:PREDICTED: histone-binding protein N1/N2-like [Acropora digitifera]|uniref:histone-binding protein N1/N2-like n=1 Tax=Acropora digitifera TaxID=70779 RepID=UPI00077ACA02|nr:PREDICTED: histone-binding protein N1/N2-like [Acropora digitifera]
MASSSTEGGVSEDVTKLMGMGKRHLLCNEVVQAVKCFEEATQTLDNKYGSGSDECGEAYLFYGKALLELARAENGVLGNALKDAEPKSEESSDEDEEKMEAVGPKISEMSPSRKEKIRDDVYDAMAEREEGHSSGRNEDRESQLNLAEVHLKLGEIQLEQEQFVDAETDYLKCLELQEKHLEPDDRLIAETAYSLGLAYSLQPSYTKAKEFYSKALAVIELKTFKLEARLAESKDKGKGKATDDDPFVVDRKELEELQNLYPEIKARVDDAQEMINSAANQLMSMTEEGFGSSKQGSSDAPAINTIPIKKTTTEQPVNDVSHLVRRKRKPEEESGDSTSGETQIPLKKARQDEEQAASEMKENGHAKS